MPRKLVCRPCESDAAGALFNLSVLLGHTQNDEVALFTHWCEFISNPDLRDSCRIDNPEVSPIARCSPDRSPAGKAPLIGLRIGRAGGQMGYPALSGLSSVVSTQAAKGAA